MLPQTVMKKYLRMMGLVVLAILSSMPVFAQLRRPIDNEHPLWMIHIDVWNAADPQKIIDMIPEDIRPYTVFNLSLSCQFDVEQDVYKLPQNAILTYKSWASVCCKNNVFFTCQPASGGHTHIMDDDMETFEYFFKNYPNFLGWNYAEQFWGYDAEDDRSSTSQTSRIACFAKLVEMSHKYGGFLTISYCGNRWSHGLNPVGMMKRNANLLAACRKYPEAILWLYKYTTAFCWLNDESVTISPFISGLAKNYGVRYDNCGYKAAMQNALGEKHKYPHAVGAATVIEQMCINGGAVWDAPETIPTECFEETTTTKENGYFVRNWRYFDHFDNIWIDMFRKVIDGTLQIPTRQEVVERTKIVLISDVPESQDNHWLKQKAFATPSDLFHGLYLQDRDPINQGQRYDTGDPAGSMMNNQMFFKKTGRYQTIPTVVELYDDLAKSIPVKIKRSQYETIWSSQAKKVNAFNAQYPELYTGDLFVAREKNRLVTYFPYTCLAGHKVATASIPLQYNSCEKLELEYGAYMSAHIREESDGISFYMNNYRNDTLTLSTNKFTIVGATERPTYTFKDRSNHKASQISEKWDATTGRFELTVKILGAADLDIRCKGTASERIVAPAKIALGIPQQPGLEDWNGELYIEAENMDYKNISRCVLDPYREYPAERGHSAMGFMEMGRNLSGALRTTLRNMKAGVYKITIRYMTRELDAAVNVKVGKSDKNFILPQTEENIWGEVTKTVTLNEGDNRLDIVNMLPSNFYFDYVTVTPTSDMDTDPSDDISEAKTPDSDLPQGWSRLTQDMYHVYSAWNRPVSNDDITVLSPHCEYNIGFPAQNIYGDASVFNDRFADLSEYDELYIEVETSSNLRLLFNRTTNQGSWVEVSRSQNSNTVKYDKQDGVSWHIDLNKIKAITKYKDGTVYTGGYAHLNALKGEWVNVTVKGLYLIKNTTGINEVHEVRPDEIIVTNMAGIRLQSVQKGFNIIRSADGIKKIWIKE